MRKHVFCLTALLCLMFFSFENVLAQKIYSCRRLPHDPVLDGKLKNDSAWKDICQSDHFFTLHSKFPASKKTFFKMGYTPEALYIGIQCQEPKPEKIKAELKDMESLWKEDSIELFIFPKPCDRYYQFVINSIGSRWSRTFLNWQAVSHKGKDYWSAEVRIPFENFLTIPEKGEIWKSNVCRNIYTGGDKDITWVQLDTGGFHQPDHFGKIIFMDDISLEERKKPERIIKEKLKKKIIANLSSIPKNCRQITREIAQLDDLEKIRDILKKSDKIEKYLINISNFGVYYRCKHFIMNVAGQKFMVGKGRKSQGWLDIKNVAEKNKNYNTISTNLNAFNKKGWVYFNAKNVEQLSIVKDTYNEKILYLKVKGHCLKEKKPFNLEVNLKIIKDIPCLFIYQRVANPFSSSREFTYGSYSSNISAYAGNGLEIKAVTPDHKKWHAIHNGHWLWVGKEAGQDAIGKKGLGIISYAPDSFCLHGPNRVFWGYSNKVVPAGCFREYRMAVMAAESPEEVNALYEKTKEIQFWTFLYPEN